MKVEIVISEGHSYSSYEKNGVKYTSVDCNARNYGGGSPCDTEEEVQSSVTHFKEWVLKEGDTPVVVDKRCSLLKWC